VFVALHSSEQQGSPACSENESKQWIILRSNWFNWFEA